MNEFKFKLGLKGKDKISGFEGIIIGRIEYLFGCNNYGLAPRMSKDGKIEDTKWFDEGRIEIISNGILPEEVRVKKNGGLNLDHPKCLGGLK